MGDYQRTLDSIRGLGGLHRKMDSDLQSLGGYLRCGTCQRTVEFVDGDIGLYMQHGWPKCHGYTMTWWTQRQIDAGEAPALDA
jgi:hypothetical protein